MGHQDLQKSRNLGAHRKLRYNRKKSQKDVMFIVFVIFQAHILTTADVGKRSEKPQEQRYVKIKYGRAAALIRPKDKTIYTIRHS